MTRLTPAIFETGGFEKTEAGYQWVFDHETLLIVENCDNVDWIAYPYGERKAWPRTVRYWEELELILKATQVGYDLE